jgi:hypothetical protein
MYAQHGPPVRLARRVADRLLASGQAWLVEPSGIQVQGMGNAQARGQRRPFLNCNDCNTGWAMAVGSWLLAVGCWLLAVGSWAPDTLAESSCTVGPQALPTQHAVELHLVISVFTSTSVGAGAGRGPVWDT